MTVNEYLRRSKLEEELGSTLLPLPMINQFISVEELFRTSRFRNIYSNSLHGVIFIYSPSTIMKLGYEGSQHVFCLRYKLDARRSISPVKEKNLTISLPIRSISNSLHKRQFQTDQSMICSRSAYIGTTPYT